VLPIYGEPYSERLGDYVRLDIRTDYAILLEGAKVTINEVSPGWALEKE
jgi:hypothetical protein